MEINNHNKIIYKNKYIKIYNSDDLLDVLNQIINKSDLSIVEYSKKAQISATTVHRYSVSNPDKRKPKLMTTCRLLYAGNALLRIYDTYNQKSIIGQKNIYFYLRNKYLNLPKYRKNESNVNSTFISESCSMEMQTFFEIIKEVGCLASIVISSKPEEYYDNALVGFDYPDKHIVTPYNTSITSSRNSRSSSSSSSKSHIKKNNTNKKEKINEELVADENSNELSVESSQQPVIVNSRKDLAKPLLFSEWLLKKHPNLISEYIMDLKSIILSSQLNKLDVIEISKIVDELELYVPSDNEDLKFIKNLIDLIIKR